MKKTEMLGCLILAVATAAVVVSGFILLAMTDQELTQSRASNIGGFPAFIGDHLEVVSRAIFVVSVLGVIGAVGIIKSKRWGYSAWMLIVGLSIAWALAGSFFELVEAFKLGTGHGRLTHFLVSVMTATTGLVGAGFLALGLRELRRRRNLLSE